MCYTGGPRCATEVKRKIREVEKLMAEDSQNQGDSLGDLQQQRKQLAHEYMLTTAGLETLEKRIQEEGDDDGRLQSQYDAYSQKRKDMIAASKAKQREPFVYQGNNPYTAHAINSSLSYTGEIPGWMEEHQRRGLSEFGTKPEIIDTIDSPVGKLAVVWEEDSLAENDYSVQKERGFIVHRIAYKHMKSGEDVGYVKMGYITNNSIKRSWGKDEWTSLRYVQECDGGQYGMIDYEKGGKEAGAPIDVAKTPEEILDAKKSIWKNAHASLEITPEGFDRSQLNWGSLVNLKKEHAPEGEKLDRDLDVIKKTTDEKLKNFKNRNKEPKIDFIQLSNPLRGKGLGHSLYVYGARKLAEKNKTLSASALQSDEAQSAWKRMKKELPVKSKTRTSIDGQKDKGFYLDFRTK